MSSYKTLIFIMASFVLLGSFIGFFGRIEPEGYFNVDVETEDITFSYPPWFSQSNDYLNVNESSEGYLTLNDSEPGYYSDVLGGSGNLSVRWDTIRYSSATPEGTIEVLYSDFSNFNSTTRTETYELRNGVRSIDLNGYESNYMKFVINLEGGTIYSFDVEGLDQINYGSYASWMLVVVALMLLVLLVVFYMGIIMSGFN